jgi:hypothetical protein
VAGIPQQDFMRPGVGTALGEAKRPLVYGGGTKGIMGVVSGAVLEAGGSVTGVLPAAMIASGGEKEAVKGVAEAKAAAEALWDRQKRDNVCSHSTVDNLK